VRHIFQAERKKGENGAMIYDFTFFNRRASFSLCCATTIFLPVLFRRHKSRNI
jgi:hypothetical protein